MEAEEAKNATENPGQKNVTEPVETIENIVLPEKVRPNMSPAPANQQLLR